MLPHVLNLEFLVMSHPICVTLDVIEALLEHGALVKEKNCLGWTPLDEALSYGNRETSKCNYNH